MTNDELKRWLFKSLDNGAEKRARKASKPLDEGYMETYMTYLALRDSVANIPDDLLSFYVRARDRLDPRHAVEIENKAFRAVGVHSTPKLATAFLESLAAELQREAGLDLRSLEPASAARH